MRATGGWRTVAAHPILVGAVTIFVAVVATYITYGLNSGVPLARTYDVVVNAPNAGHLFRDADVSMAGSRIGQVVSSEAVPHADGIATARLHLKLARIADPLPVDTRFVIRPKSYAGADYVDVLRGHARAVIPDGGSVPLARFAPHVQLEDFLSTYRAPVRAGMREQLRGLSYGLAGRGRDLNVAIGRLDVLLGHLRGGAHVLRAPGTHLPRFIRGLGRVSAEVAPVGREQADAFAELHRTYAALGDRPKALRDLIVAAPGAERAVVRDAPSITAWLRSSRRLAVALAPAARELGGASRSLAAGLGAGARGLPATRRTLPQLDALSRSLGDFATAPAVIEAIDRLSLLGSTLRPLTATLAPTETRCRYASLLFRNLASSLQEGPQTGAALRVVLLAVTAAPDSEAGLASKPSVNPDGLGLGALHANPYPYTAAPGQPRSCEAGQERYLRGRAEIGNPRPSPDAVTESPHQR